MYHNHKPQCLRLLVLNWCTTWREIALCASPPPLPCLMQSFHDIGIATITLCHSEKRNCLSGSMMCQLSDIVSDLELWSKDPGSNGRAVLLKSEDKYFFCSGADLTSTVAHISREWFDLVLQEIYWCFFLMFNDLFWSSHSYYVNIKERTSNNELFHTTWARALLT